MLVSTTALAHHLRAPSAPASAHPVFSRRGSSRSRPLPASVDDAIEVPRTTTTTTSPPHHHHTTTAAAAFQLAPWWIAEGGVQFDCTGCGKCCKVEGDVWASPEEVSGLAAHVGLDATDFVEQYTSELVGTHCVSPSIQPPLQPKTTYSTTPQPRHPKAPPPHHPTNRPTHQPTNPPPHHAPHAAGRHPKDGPGCRVRSSTVVAWRVHFWSITSALCTNHGRSSAGKVVAAAVVKRGGAVERWSGGAVGWGGCVE